MNSTNPTKRTALTFELCIEDAPEWPLLRYEAHIAFTPFKTMPGGCLRGELTLRDTRQFQEAIMQTVYIASDQPATLPLPKIAAEYDANGVDLNCVFTDEDYTRGGVFTTSSISFTRCYACACPE